MHYNANTGPRQPLSRKPRRVSDINAMGYSPYSNPPNQGFTPTPQNTVPVSSSQTDFMSQTVEQPSFDGISNHPPQYGYSANAPFVAPNVQQMPPQFNVLGQPIVQDMAFQYGQQLANTGKQVVQQNLEKYVPISRLKYYFAVDTRYVMAKLGLLFFPFTHKDWSMKYEQDSPIQPRFEINAPDLYIPTMAYLTYVVVACLILGTQQKFSPEQIGIIASSALAWCIMELAFYSLILYIFGIQTSLRTLDLLAFCGYKFVGMIAAVLLGLAGGHWAYYAGWLYTSFALAFFLVRTMKVQILQEANPQMNYYGDASFHGTKQRRYFLLYLALIQPCLAWWLTHYLVPSEKAVVP